MTKTKRRHKAHPWAAAWPLALPFALHAQTTDPVPATLPAVQVTAAADTAGSLDQPARTGSRLGITPLQTPASIEVLPGETIRERGDTAIHEAVSRATGITMSPAPGNGGTALAARGFTGHGSVMQLFDGTRLYVGAGTITFPFDTWSADRIEVLRGAASVMFGEGAIGAAVNVVPKKPTRGAIENETYLAPGSYNTRNVAFGSGGAVDDRWSYRFDVSSRHTDGFMDRGDADSLAVGLAVRFDLDPRFHVTLSHDEGHQQPQRYQGVPLVNGELDDRTKRRNYNVEDAVLKYTDRWTRLAAEWTPTPAVTVRNQLYYLDSERHWRNTETYTYRPATGLVARGDYLEIGHDQDQVGNRFDATMDLPFLGLDHRLMAGFDVNRIHFQHTNDSPYGGASTVDPYDFEPGNYTSPQAYTPRYRTRTDTQAVFLEDRLAFSPRWSLVTGLRRDHAEVRREDLVVATNGFEKTWSYTTGRIGVVFAPTPGQSAYAQVARAVDPLGGLVSTSASQAQYDLTTGRQVEVGYKQLFDDKRSAWSVAVYDIEKRKLLMRSDLSSTVQQQIGQQSSTGIEVTLDLALSNTVRLEANAAKLRARYDDFQEVVGGVMVSRNGNTPVNTPEEAANLWLDWRFLPQWKAAAGVRYVGTRQVDTANTRQIGSYTVGDAVLAWTPRQDLRLGLQVANLFDRDYPLTTSNGGNQWLLGRPRSVELSAHVHF